jgi:hypothetical protein
MHSLQPFCITKGELMVDQLKHVNPKVGINSYTTQSFTEKQIATVKSILSQYNPDFITEKDAKEIFRAFRQAGLQPGDDLRDAVKAEGFDWKLLRYLARIKRRASTSGDSTDIEASSLQSLQSILSQYDLSHLSPEQESELLAKLSDAGLMKSENIIDLST